jgi:hypothetical protein
MHLPAAEPSTIHTESRSSTLPPTVVRPTETPAGAIRIEGYVA